jgi:hypothetical protein
MIGFFLRASQVAHLRALVLSVWTAIHPGLPTMGDAPAIADTIALTVEQDRDPVFGDQDFEAAVMAYWALRESSLLRRAVGDNGQSWGVWQEPREVGSRDLETQARFWLRRLHMGALECPESPAAPLSGGCRAARQLADRRIERVREILAGL